jgi:hypothetical protein
VPNQQSADGLRSYRSSLSSALVYGELDYGRDDERCYHHDHQRVSRAELGIDYWCNNTGTDGTFPGFARRPTLTWVSTRGVEFRTSAPLASRFGSGLQFLLFLLELSPPDQIRYESIGYLQDNLRSLTT